jgi:hypothetical protein
LIAWRCLAIYLGMPLLLRILGWMILYRILFGMVEYRGSACSIPILTESNPVSTKAKYSLALQSSHHLNFLSSYPLHFNSISRSPKLNFTHPLPVHSVPQNLYSFPFESGTPFNILNGMNSNTNPSGSLHMNILLTQPSPSPNSKNTSHP